MVDPKWIHKNLLVQGHLVAIVAEPNAGKTTIMEWIAGQISAEHRVIYINADISGGDAKTAYKKAKDGNYELLLPDMKIGLSMNDIVNNLEAMNSTASNLSNIVLICDTLKKMVDVISKGASKRLYTTLRGLTAKGMTVILLAHTNKYKGEDGMPIYEGTGDLRSDVDELIYLIPDKQPDGILTVSTYPDKQRATFEEQLSFTITKDRKVEQIGYVDVSARKQALQQRSKDQQVIEVITEILQKESASQSEIIIHCKDNHKISKNNVLKVLSRYESGSEILWNKRKERQNNKVIYSFATEVFNNVLPLER